MLIYYFFSHSLSHNSKFNNSRIDRIYDEEFSIEFYKEQFIQVK